MRCKKRLLIGSITLVLFIGFIMLDKSGVTNHAIVTGIIGAITGYYVVRYMNKRRRADKKG